MCKFVCLNKLILIISSFFYKWVEKEIYTNDRVFICTDTHTIEWKTIYHWLINWFTWILLFCWKWWNMNFIFRFYENQPQKFFWFAHNTLKSGSVSRVWARRISTILREWFALRWWIKHFFGERWTDVNPFENVSIME